ncbi:thiopurine S-methyltransferase [Undibacterium fentianense]|uniref:Thiopurine S-methyltransferase n=1 Tax=Undibacterium fentianense TaxID=2828728 RepID=A0A941E5M7_9BURK|nr:thiopurine S-methyltransferase [Undibacterium fentianense]MBR7801401.1 thiopurine S-methyltransferase [Undibacterium fentianense]
MDINFWHEKWRRGEIGFHRQDINPHLLAHLHQLKLKSGQHILLPLCGKTKDIAYLLNQGYQVTGVELSELAVRELFEDLSLTPEVTQVAGFQCYSANKIRIFVGDFFSFNHDLLGKVDAIYDRAALVALPLAMRKDYSRHLSHITHCAPQLLITYEYQQDAVEGPPFSISEQEVFEHYAKAYEITLLERVDVAGGMKGKVASTEVVYHLNTCSR